MLNVSFMSDSNRTRVTLTLTFIDRIVFFINAEEALRRHIGQWTCPELNTSVLHTAQYMLPITFYIKRNLLQCHMVTTSK